MPGWSSSRSTAVLTSCSARSCGQWTFILVQEMGNFIEPVIPFA